jgi:DNA polymerase-4
VCRSDGARLRLIRSLRVWRRILWQNRPLRSYGWAGSTVTLKLKAADFRLRTRAHSLGSATQLAAKIFAAARSLLERETDGTKFRLLGVGIGALTTADHADPSDFVDDRAVEAEHAVDRVRARFGDDALVRGLAFEGPEER